MAYNKEKQLKENIDAIRCALRLATLHNAPSEEERDTLHKYSGFGGLKFILNDCNEPGDIAKWGKSDSRYFESARELFRIIHDFSRNDSENRQYLDSLKSSVLTSFYTDVRIVDAISDAVKASGIEVSRFLDPSAGKGVFVDSFRRNYPFTEVLAYEKDLITGKVLSALNPSSLIRVEGFEKIEKDFDGYFDVVSSNIPFGNFAVADPAYALSKSLAHRQSAKAIHNYFFLKSLDQTREGGIVAFIASQGVMNAASPFVRMEMMRQANLVAAIRLPNNTFSDSAGTDVGSDLIILQKHTGKKSLSAEEELFIQSVVDRQTKVSGNKFFQAFPQNVICTDAKVGTDQYGKPAIVYHHDGGIDGIAGDLRKALDESLRLRLNLELYNSNGIKPPTPDPIKPESKETPKVEKKAEKKSSLTNTPLMQQYQEMKKKHPDAVLLFRVGDFYEIFGKDAVIASEILGITLIRRPTGVKSRIELAGFPRHALDTYLPKLVRAGKRVAICEQLEDPKLTKTPKQKVVETVMPNQPPKVEPKPESNPRTKTEQAPTSASAPAEAPKARPVKETETGGRPNYTDNPDSRLYAYNLFGELEPIGRPRRQPKPAKDAPKTKPSAEVKDIHVKKFRPLTEKELEFYGSLNWESNPPINGFYETMMNVAHRQLAEQEKERLRSASASFEAFVKSGKETQESEKASRQIRKDLSPRPFSEDIRFFHHNGSMAVQDGLVGFLSDVRKNSATFIPLDLNREQEEKALLYVALSDTYQQLYHYEAETRTESTELRQHLNDYYNEFISKYGFLNEKDNKKLILMDANGRDALALEHSVNDVFYKADIFDHPVAFSVNELQHVDTPLDALSASLNKYGGVDMGYMSSLVDMDEDEILESLKGHIFYNPMIEGYEIKDRFIAGNVIAKAESVRGWIEREEERIKDFPGYDGVEPFIALSKDSLKALEESRPRRIEFDQLDFNFGERWIPVGIYSAYMSNLYGTNITVNYSSSLDEYSADASRKNMKIWEEFCVRGYYRTYDGMALLKHALHNTEPDIKKSIGKDNAGNDIKVPDSVAMQQAHAKIDEIRNGFSDWLKEQSPEFKEKLTDLYNKNSTVMSDLSMTEVTRLSPA